MRVRSGGAYWESRVGARHGPKGYVHTAGGRERVWGNSGDGQEGEGTSKELGQRG